MAYKFPYAGSEDKPRMVVKVAPCRPKPLAKKIISGVPDRIPDLAPQVIDARPVNIPLMSDALRNILLTVAQETNVHPNDIVGSSRSLKTVAARREFIWRARNKTNASFPRIGRAINRDHSTVVYHYQYKEAELSGRPLDKLSIANEKRIKRIANQTELNDRQIKVRGLLLRGYSNPNMAVELGVSPSLIKFDRAVIKKLDPIPEKYLRGMK